MIIISNILFPITLLGGGYYNYGYIFVNMSIFFMDDVATQQWRLLDVAQLNDTLTDLKCGYCNQPSLCFSRGQCEPWLFLHTITSL